jgi:pimeloyl-ACP methyl ester carboxylesterase
LQRISLPVHKSTAPTLVFLHFLGGSGQSWAEVIRRLPDGIGHTLVDLPGFGDAAVLGGSSVSAMADHVVAHIRQSVIGPFALVGHSMGAKIAAVVARRAENGEAGLPDLTHIVLLAGSPPAPEPMDEDRRSEMRGWFAGSETERTAQAKLYVDRNVAGTLDRETYDRTVADVMRANRSAWVAWLDGGSREDWAARIGTLQTPALIIAGAADADLGAAAQRDLMARHFSDHRLVTVADASHLIPMEQPAMLAGLIVEHLQFDASVTLDERYCELIQSDRVSHNTRAALIARLNPARDAVTALFNDSEIDTLRAMVERVIPLGTEADDAPIIDLPALVATALVEPRGWRFAALPPDVAAWRAGLATLEQRAMEIYHQQFSALDPSQQDGILTEIEAATDMVSNEGNINFLNATQMKLWFEDVRSFAARAYMSHPATLARIGYSGIAYGGDGPAKPGFQQLGLDAAEPWEPHAVQPKQRRGSRA